MTLPSRTRLRYLRELVVHLARRELSLSYRETVLGWSWPLARQLAQVAVLVFVFSKLVNLHIKNYPAFVLSGLIVWVWFSTGMVASTRSILGNRQFAMRPGFPTAVLPIIAITVGLFDAIVALPLLFALLAAQHDLRASAVLLPLVFVVQFVLMCGLAWIVASVSVILRDIPNLIGVLILLGFYATPIYFNVHTVPQRFRWVVDLNPAAVLIGAERASLLGERWPPVASLVGVAVGSLAVAAGGYICFHRLSRVFADEL
jgi:lipopolysaccharide transport system permease protein